MKTRKSRPFVIGLTGGIASGKSAVAEAFEALEVPVIDTDQLSREVVAPGSDAIVEIQEAFGRDVLDAGGGLDRRKMRQLVFEDAATRQQLESILHPRIASLLERRLANTGPGWCVVAIPLLIEAGWQDRVDRILVVDAPPGEQLSRLLVRDRMDEAAARRMIDAQVSREERLTVAHDVLDNSSDLAGLSALVGRLAHAYTALAHESS